MSGENETWKTGIVMSVEPLSIYLGDMPVESENVLVNPQLLRHTRKAKLSQIKGELQGDPQVQVDSGDLECEVEFEPLLEVGDRVLLMPWKGGQEFAVVCKLG